MSVHLSMWSHIVFFLLSSLSFSMYVLVHREKPKEHVGIRLSIFLCPRKKGSSVNSDTRIDYDRHDHLTRWLISCLSQSIIQVTMMTLLLCIHCFLFHQRKKKSIHINFSYRFFHVHRVSSYVMSPIDNICFFFSYSLTNYTDKKMQMSFSKRE
jgi:hypothetical protein